MDLISDWRAAMGSRYQEAVVAAFWEAVESGAEELDAMAAGLRAHVDARAAWVDRLCREREERVRAAQRPRWIDGQVAALMAERAARPEHPGWTEYRRRARASVGRERVTAWDAAAGRAVALRIPAVVWGGSAGVRKEVDPCPHQLQIEGYDAAAELGPWVEATPLDAASWEVEPWIVRAIHGDHRDREGHFGVAGAAAMG